MKKSFKIKAYSKLALFVFLLGFYAQFSASAQKWDATGSWNGYYVIKSFGILFSVTITNQDFASGNISGYDDQGAPVTGNVNGTNLTFYDPGVFGGSSFIGTISDNGTNMAGSLSESDTGGTWYGYWGLANTTAPAILYAAPVFTKNPTSIVTNSGASVTFVIAVTGHPVPALQWRFNGVNISNATNLSFTIAPTATWNAGIYDVVASNVVGTNASATASLSFLDISCFPGLILHGAVGAVFNIQATVSLSPPNWVAIATVTLDSSQTYTFVDSSSATNAGMYYRAVPQ